MQNMRDLIIVYEPLHQVAAYELKKDIAKIDDDKELGRIVGTKDGSVNVILWSVKEWRKNKKAGAVSDNAKILFLGNIKETSDERRVVDLLYDNYGIKYGWINDHMFLWVDPADPMIKQHYNDFVYELKTLSNADVPIVNVSIGTKLIRFVIYLGLAAIAFMSLPAGIPILGLLMLAVILIYYKTSSSKEAVSVARQQMVYGVTKVYYNELERFMRQ